MFDFGDSLVRVLGALVAGGSFGESIVGAAIEVFDPVPVGGAVVGSSLAGALASLWSDL